VSLLSDMCKEVHADHDAIDISSRTSTHRRSKLWRVNDVDGASTFGSDWHGLALLLRLQLLILSSLAFHGYNLHDLDWCCTKSHFHLSKYAITSPCIESSHYVRT
jgi:hypothetical protein